jgi:hypothetical protein
MDKTPMLHNLILQWEKQKRICERGATRHTEENARVLLAQAIVFDQVISALRKVLDA